MSQAIHPAVNPNNTHVNRMPQHFEEGDRLARRDTWTDETTSTWIVKEVAEETTTASCGYRYRLEQLNGDQAIYQTHGELQLLAARNEIRWT